MDCQASIFFPGDHDSAEIFCGRKGPQHFMHRAQGVAHDAYGNDVKYNITWWEKKKND